MKLEIINAYSWMESATQGNQVEIKGLCNDEPDDLPILYWNYSPRPPCYLFFRVAYQIGVGIVFDF